MIKLLYSEDSSQVEDIIELLRTYSFAFETKKDTSVKEIQLIEGKRSYTGKEDIYNYLEKLISEVGEWWYCQC